MSFFSSVEWSEESTSNVCFINYGIEKIPTCLSWSNVVDPGTTSSDRTKAVGRLVHEVVSTIGLHGDVITVSGEKYGAIYAAAFCRIAKDNDMLISVLIGEQE